MKDKKAYVHLTPKLRKKYRNGLVTSDEYLAINKHVLGCRTCLDRFKKDSQNQIFPEFDLYLDEAQSQLLPAKKTCPPTNWLQRYPEEYDEKDLALAEMHFVDYHVMHCQRCDAILGQIFAPIVAQHMAEREKRLEGLERLSIKWWEAYFGGKERLEDMKKRAGHSSIVSFSKHFINLMSKLSPEALGEEEEEDYPTIH